VHEQSGEIAAVGEDVLAAAMAAAPLAGGAGAGLILEADPNRAIEKASADT
jgi:hypothetical protein